MLVNLSFWILDAIAKNSSNSARTNSKKSFQDWNISKPNVLASFFSENKD